MYDDQGAALVHSPRSLIIRRPAALYRPDVHGEVVETEVLSRVPGIQAKVCRRIVRAKRKFTLAAGLSDNTLLVSSLAFYCNKLKPGERVPVDPIEAVYRDKPRIWKRHLKAARLILRIWQHWTKAAFPTRTFLLPTNYLQRLALVGLYPWQDWKDYYAFSHLNSALLIDQATQEFADRYRILTRTQSWLRSRARQEGYVPPFPPEFQPAETAELAVMPPIVPKAPLTYYEATMQVGLKGLFSR